MNGKLASKRKNNQLNAKSIRNGSFYIPKTTLTLRIEMSRNVFFNNPMLSFCEKSKNKQQKISRIDT